MSPLSAEYHASSTTNLDNDDDDHNKRDIVVTQSDTQELSWIKYLCDHHNEATAAATCALAETVIPMTQTQSHAASIHKFCVTNTC